MTDILQHNGQLLPEVLPLNWLGLAPGVILELPDLMYNKPLNPVELGGFGFPKILLLVLWDAFGLCFNVITVQNLITIVGGTLLLAVASC